jgi:hypothetical protein
MRKAIIVILVLLLNSLWSCKKTGEPGINGTAPINDSLVRVSFNGVSVDVVISKEEGDTVDAILTFHGTVIWDSLIVNAAYTSLNKVRDITTVPNVMFVSVAYPEEGLPMGDNVREAEAALLWVKNNAARQLGIHIRKVFLVGHSQGGYVVTRLNTLHATDGAVANGPGPLNLELRCRLEETGQIVAGDVCGWMRNFYGSVLTNPGPYTDRSLLTFTNNHKSDILFVQGMQDSQIHMTSYPSFKQKMDSCTNCLGRQFHEEPNYGHTALFDSPNAKVVYNQFLSR